MARGKPFSRPLARLARQGTRAAVAMTPPQFEPVVRTKPPKLAYPEDTLRNEFLRRNPAARRIPVNLNAGSLAERHIADRFVGLQVRLMESEGLSEEEAYDKTSRIINSELSHHVDRDLTEYGSIIDPNVDNVQSQLYLASVRDSQRDTRLHRAFVKERKGK